MPALVKVTLGFFAGIALSLLFSHYFNQALYTTVSGQRAVQTASTSTPHMGAMQTQANQAVAGDDSGQAVKGNDSANTPATSASLPAGVAYQDSLPLGDGKYVTAGPKLGYVYLCHVASGGQGAQGKASWIHGSMWTPSQKVAVTGSVSWPNASYHMSVSGTSRTITANGLPADHSSGVFPILKSDPAFQYDGNPNSIKAQSYSYTLPVSPALLPTPQCIFGQVGIMNDGLPLFDGFDAEYRDAVAHETQDAWEAHPDQAGVYHYHGFESGYLNDSVSTVVGYAFDGFPITGGKLPSGKYVTSSELDVCHGMTSVIVLDGKQQTSYHYVLTQDFPYSVACFRGASHEPKPGSGVNGTQAQTQPQTGQQAGPPQAAIAACSGKSVSASCSFTTPNGTVTGSCENTPDGTFACIPAR